MYVCIYTGICVMYTCVYVHTAVCMQALMCWSKKGERRNVYALCFVLHLTFSSVRFSVPAVGEIVVYVDGMQGLIKCNELIQWLYQLASSKVGLFLAGYVGREREREREKERERTRIMWIMVWPTRKSNLQRKYAKVYVLWIEENNLWRCDIDTGTESNFL